MKMPCLTFFESMSVNNAPTRVLENYQHHCNYKNKKMLA